MRFMSCLGVLGLPVFSLGMLLALLIFPAGGGSAESGERSVTKGTLNDLPVRLDVKEDHMTFTDRLSDEEGNYLLAAARSAIEEVLLGNGGKEEYDESGLSSRLVQRRGTFVTLTMEGNLRGCIGHIIPQESLFDGVRINAVNAAFKDPRFRPLSKEELKRIKVEVSILTEPKPISYSGYQDLLEKLRPGTDGVIIKKGGYQATFLPQVWGAIAGKR